MSGWAPRLLDRASAVVSSLGDNCTTWAAAGQTRTNAMNSRRVMSFLAFRRAGSGARARILPGPGGSPQAPQERRRLPGAHAQHRVHRLAQLVAQHLHVRLRAHAEVIARA